MLKYPGAHCKAEPDFPRLQESNLSLTTYSLPLPRAWSTLSFAGSSVIDRYSQGLKLLYNSYILINVYVNISHKCILAKSIDSVANYMHCVGL